MPSIIDEFSIATAQYQTERLKVIEALEKKGLESEEFDTVTDEYLKAVLRNKYAFILTNPTGLEPIEQRTKEIEFVTLDMKELRNKISENNSGMIEEFMNKFMNDLKSDIILHNAYTEILKQRREHYR